MCYTAQVCGYSCVTKYISGKATVQRDPRDSSTERNARHGWRSDRILGSLTAAAAEPEVPPVMQESHRRLGLSDRNERGETEGPARAPPRPQYF